MISDSERVRPCPCPKGDHFGGPPSKSMYVCTICGKQVRRDRIREHYGSYVDMTVLGQTDRRIREQSLSRLSVDKRKHSKGVKDYFDKNKNFQLTMKIKISGLRPKVQNQRRDPICLPKNEKIH